MSKHEVKVVKIETVLPHNNSDNLELVQIWGYQVVVKRNQFPLGSLAAYIESDYKVDVTRPEFVFLDEGKGKQFQRITMRKFRGERSYGLLVKAPEGSVEGDNVMELLGVERWEPPPQKGSQGDMLSGLQAKGPDIHVPVYDLENFRKFHRLFNEGERVILTEKIHGTNARYLFDGEAMHCGSRTTWKKAPGEFIKTVTYPDVVTGESVTKDLFSPENAWWTTLKQNPWVEAWCRNHPNMVLFGEVYGPNVQGVQFAYGKQQGQYGFAAFDVLSAGRWVDNNEMLDNPEYSVGLQETAPVLYRGALGREILENLAEEDSVFSGQKIREGIVVKLEVGERFDPKYGRVALKFVSDRYLCMK
jgi:RNA ligase (TIGR02306 family)